MGVGLADGPASGDAEGDGEGEGEGVGVGSGGHAFVPGVSSNVPRTPRMVISFWS